MIYQLGSSFDFPPAGKANKDGLLAIGGDLHPERILAAYRKGIFPWFEEGQPFLWWSPNPRMVLIPDKILISKSMRKILRDDVFEIRFDTSFTKVMEACAKTDRIGQDGTWITSDMIQAYSALHEMGYAHSFEAYNTRNELVGGLYGLAIGKIFFGESMFHLESNASKAAFINLTYFLQKEGFQLIDAQQDTDHLRSLGAELIQRSKFLRMVEEYVNLAFTVGKWAT